MTTLRDALEAALFENPDDLATHMAYADHLHDQGDPRGELIQVQLALEDEGRSSAERAELARREKELLKQTLRPMLGDLAPILLDRQKSWETPKFTLRRGWVDRLQWPTLEFEEVRTLVESPALRLLQTLTVNDLGDTEEHEDEEELRRLGLPADIGYSSCLHRLARAPWVGGLRHLQVGKDCSDYPEDRFNSQSMAEGVESVVAQAPRLQTLRLFARGVEEEPLFALPLGELRELVYFHGRSFSCRALGENSSLRNLQTLILHPASLHRRASSPTGLESIGGLLYSGNLPNLRHLGLRLSDMGDTGCRELIDSGILNRLQVLDLRHGCIGDAGARLLAPALVRLERVDLSDNEISEEVWQELVSLGIRLVGGAHTQHAPGNEDWRYQADIE